MSWKAVSHKKLHLKAYGCLDVGLCRQGARVTEQMTFLWIFMLLNRAVRLSTCIKKYSTSEKLESRTHFHLMFAFISLLLVCLSKPTALCGIDWIWISFPVNDSSGRSIAQSSKKQHGSAWQHQRGSWKIAGRMNNFFKDRYACVHVHGNKNVPPGVNPNVQPFKKQMPWLIDKLLSPGQKQLTISHWLTWGCFFYPCAFKMSHSTVNQHCTSLLYIRDMKAVKKWFP